MHGHLRSHVDSQRRMASKFSYGWNRINRTPKWNYFYKHSNGPWGDGWQWNITLCGDGDEDDDDDVQHKWNGREWNKPKPKSHRSSDAININLTPLSCALCIFLFIYCASYFKIIHTYGICSHVFLLLLITFLKFYFSLLVTTSLSPLSLAFALSIVTS